MPNHHGVTFAVQNVPQLGDRVLELVHGGGDGRARTAALPPVVLLQQRIRRLEIQVIALRVNQPSERLWRYGHRWRVRLQKTWRWIALHSRQSWRRIRP